MVTIVGNTVPHAHGRRCATQRKRRPTAKTGHIVRGIPYVSMAIVENSVESVETWDCLRTLHRLLYVS